MSNKTDKNEEYYDNENVGEEYYDEDEFNEETGEVEKKDNIIDPNLETVEYYEYVEEYFDPEEDKNNIKNNSKEEYEEIVYVDNKKDEYNNPESNIKEDGEFINENKSVVNEENLDENKNEMIEEEGEYNDEYDGEYSAEGSENVVVGNGKEEGEYNDEYNGERYEDDKGKKELEEEGEYNDEYEGEGYEKGKKELEEEGEYNDEFEGEGYKKGKKKLEEEGEYNDEYEGESYDKGKKELEEEGEYNDEYDGEYGEEEYPGEGYGEDDYFEQNGEYYEEDGEFEKNYEGKNIKKKKVVDRVIKKERPKSLPQIGFTRLTREDKFIEKNQRFRNILKVTQRRNYFKEFHKFNIVRFHGKDKYGCCVLVIYEPVMKNYTSMVEKFFHFLVVKLNEFSKKEYVLVYCFNKANKIKKMSFNFYQICYSSLPKRYKKNMKRLYLVNSPSVVSVITKMIKKIVINNKSWKKFKICSSLRDVSDQIELLETPFSFRLLRNEIKISHRNEKSRFPVFGKELRKLMLRKVNEKKEVPFFVEQIAEKIKTKLNVRGIFRISGNKIEIDSLKRILDLGYCVDFRDVNIHTCCSLIKAWLRELPIPILTLKLFKEFISFKLTNDENFLDDDIQRMIAVCEKIPLYYYNVCNCIFKLLNLVVKEERNLLNAKGVGAIFAPNLLRSRKNVGFGVVGKKITVIVFLIENAFRIWKDYESKEMRISNLNKKLRKRMEQEFGTRQALTKQYQLTIYELKKKNVMLERLVRKCKFNAKQKKKLADEKEKKLKYSKKRFEIQKEKMKNLSKCYREMKVKHEHFKKVSSKKKSLEKEVLNLKKNMESEIKKRVANTVYKFREECSEEDESKLKTMLEDEKRITIMLSQRLSEQEKVILEYNKKLQNDDNLDYYDLKRLVENTEREKVEIERINQKNEQLIDELEKVNTKNEQVIEVLGKKEKIMEKKMKKLEKETKKLKEENWNLSEKIITTEKEKKKETLPWEKTPKKTEDVNLKACIPDEINDILADYEIL